MLKDRFTSALRKTLPVALLTVSAATAATVLAPEASAQSRHNVSTSARPVRSTAVANSSYPEPSPSRRPAVAAIVDLERNTVAFSDGQGNFASAPKTLAEAEVLPVSTVGSVESRFINTTTSLASQLAAEPTRVFCADGASKWIPTYLSELRTRNQLPVFSSGDVIGNGIIVGSEPVPQQQTRIVVTSTGPEVERDTSIVGNVARNTKGQIKGQTESTAYSIFNDITGTLSGAVYRTADRAIGKATGRGY